MSNDGRIVRFYEDDIYGTAERSRPGALSMLRKPQNVNRKAVPVFRWIGRHQWEYLGNYDMKHLHDVGDEWKDYTGWDGWTGPVRVRSDDKPPSNAMLKEAACKSKEARGIF